MSAARAASWRVGLAALATLGLAGCGMAAPVTRAYDGQLVQGRYIPPSAYAAFLRGAIAEAAAKPADALAAYAEAARIDPQGVEIWTRIAAVRCAASPSDRLADEALARALSLDERFAQAWGIKATCALSRGDEATARAAAAKAVAYDPRADSANVLLAETAGAGRRGAARDALVALTMTAQDPVFAWTALAAWADTHDDVGLRALAFERLVAIAPSLRAVAARAAEKLALEGHTGEARAVAAAAADASEAPFPADRMALAARLAVDDAIARGDASLALRRATRVRVTIEEAAARALLAGDSRLAQEIAADAARAAGDDAGVRLVLAAGNRRDVLATLAESRRVHAPVSGAAWVVLGKALVFAVPEAQARATLAAVAHDPITAGDTLVLSRVPSDGGAVVAR